MIASTERGQRGINRVLAKLEHSINTGNYYEAHQMYRTLYFRYIAQRKYFECMDLLYTGALRLVRNAQEPSAADLGLLIVDTLEKSGHRTNIELWIERFSELIENLSSTTVERETLINRCIKWSGEVSGHNLGHPSLHKRIARLLWSEGNTEQARHHVLLCRDGNMCGRFLVKISEKKSYTSEVDLIIVQAVLQQLCLKDRKTAEETFTTYIRQHPDIKRKAAPYKEILLNFIYFLFLCIDINRSAAFRSLCDLYKPSLDRDPSFQKYLVKIGVLFFDINPSPASSGANMMGGMFGDLFSGLFQGFDDDDENNELLQERRHGDGDGSHISHELD
uniref:Golgi to ER traffic protein 4 homolog n=1 Tax=Glossina palpalis gambiensis TaxID=67801 RepID=A0A1B0BHN8_9MUSC